MEDNFPSANQDPTQESPWICESDTAKEVPQSRYKIRRSLQPTKLLSLNHTNPRRHHSPSPSTFNPSILTCNSPNPTPPNLIKHTSAVNHSLSDVLVSRGDHSVQQSKKKSTNHSKSRSSQSPSVFGSTPPKPLPAVFNPVHLPIFSIVEKSVR